MTARVKTREDDERELQMLRMRDLGWSSPAIGRRFERPAEAVRTLFQRIDADTAKSEASNPRYPSYAHGVSRSVGIELNV
jgi:uncharacterized alpha-E superfamily protein